MALLERVATLVRANLNDLVDKAEDPEKMLKQVILDMQNQMLQVKTQVAIAMADHQVLVKKKAEHEQNSADWLRRAEIAVEKDEDLARSAIERSISLRSTAASYDKQIADQAVQMENLKSALSQLQSKLQEAQTKVDLLVAQHRRARAMSIAGDARLKLDDGSSGMAFDRMKRKVELTEAEGSAKNELVRDSIEDRFLKLERNDEVERLLAEIKSRKG